MRKLSDGCEFGSITLEEILRDKLIFGICDNKVRERLLREPRLTLAKTNEICRAAESLDTQMKTITDGSSTLVNAVKTQECRNDRQSLQEAQILPEKPKIAVNKQDTPECWYCGCKHDLRKRELCPAFGKLCKKCHKPIILPASAVALQTL